MSMKDRIIDVNKRDEELRKEEVKKELRAIADKMGKKLDISKACQSKKDIPGVLRALDEYDELKDQYEEKELRISGDMTTANTNHRILLDNSSNESLESRVLIVPTKTYEGTFEDRDCYITLEKQKSATEDVQLVDLTDYIKTHEYDMSDKAGALQTIHGVNIDYRDDDPETFDRLSREIENESYINSINKMILGGLSTGKTLVVLDPTALSTAIHTYLCAKAKKNTIIITNNTGMKKLDITDANGVALIKRVNGKVIYKDSFEVVEIDNDFFEDLPNGAPCFIGDLFGACALIKYREKRELQANGVDGFETYSYRYIDYVKAIQRTASDKAYIAGYLA
ncbi:MAG: hypothetical protein PHP50_11715 [Lachnospiraceae bacterium]|nr:hypothetical protein [Lachnospiraceae bacterium]